MRGGFVKDLLKEGLLIEVDGVVIVGKGLSRTLLAVSVAPGSTNALIGVKFNNLVFTHCFFCHFTTGCALLFYFRPF